jgi:hypothetical protein
MAGINHRHNSHWPVPWYPEKGEVPHAPPRTEPMWQTPRQEQEARGSPHINISLTWLCTKIKIGRRPPKVCTCAHSPRSQFTEPRAACILHTAALVKVISGWAACIPSSASRCDGREGHHLPGRHCVALGCGARVHSSVRPC